MSILYIKTRDITLSSYSRSGLYLHAESNLRSNATVVLMILRAMVPSCLHAVFVWTNAARWDTADMICP